MSTRLDIVVRAAAVAFLVTPDDILGRSRKQPTARARQAVCWYARTRFQWSLPQVARRVGLSDHTTIIHSVKVVDLALEYSRHPHHNSLHRFVELADEYLDPAAHVHPPPNFT